jgi:hypothetical protein
MIAGLCAVAGAFIVMGQCFIWLKSGDWLPVSVGMVLYAMGFSIPDIELSWVGVQKMIDGVIGAVIDWPASITLIVLGALVAIVAGYVEWKGHAERRKQRP